MHLQKSSATATAPASTNTVLSYSTVVEPPFPDRSFDERMKQLVTKPAPQSASSQSSRYPNMHTCETSQDFQRLVRDEGQHVTVVRLHASWCRACKRAAPLFERLAGQNPDIKFVQLPYTKANQEIVAELGVSELPSGQIYLPGGELVEVQKMNTKFFQDFAQLLHSYTEGQSALPPQPDAVSATYSSPCRY